jgi:hypothetical protein
VADDVAWHHVQRIEVLAAGLDLGGFKVRFAAWVKMRGDARRLTRERDSPTILPDAVS